MPLAAIVYFFVPKSVLLLSIRIRVERGESIMPDTSDKKEQREPRAQQESAQEKQSPLEKRIEEGAQDVVQEARQDVAVTRLPWFHGLMTAVSYIGYQAWLSIGLVVLAVLIFWIVDLRLEAITLAVVYAVSVILTALIKKGVGRPRP